MKKLFLLPLLLLLPVLVHAQQYQFTAPDCEFSFTYQVIANAITAQAGPLAGNRIPPTQNVNNTIAGYDNRLKSCTTWTITYQTQGVTATSMELDQAPDVAGVPGSWSTWTTPAPGTVFPIVTSGAGAVGQATAFSFQPWVSFILNSATGTGIVTGHVIGWRPQAGQDSTATGISVSPVSTDPCQSSAIPKKSAVISVTSATTTSLVAVSGTTTVYVCGYNFSISQVVTTANTIQLESGTGATCSSPVAQTGLYGAGGVTAGIPIVVSVGNGSNTVFKGAAGAGVCALTAIGASGSFQGELTYVQQ